MVVAPAQAVGGAGNWRTVINGVAVDLLAIRDWGVRSGPSPRRLDSDSNQTRP